MTGRRILGALVLALVAGSIGACGASSPPPPKPPVPESTVRAVALLDHVPHDPMQPGAFVVDVARLRALLGGGTADLYAAVRTTDQAAKHFAELVHHGHRWQRLLR
jgi:hypothetical protein